MENKSKGIEVTIKMGDKTETRTLLPVWESLQNRTEMSKDIIESHELLEAIIEQVSSAFGEFFADMLFEEIDKK